MIIDLTHVIDEDMPVYPGTERPSLRCANTYEKDGFRETKLSMYSHTGTHIDSPAHIFDGKKTLDAFSADSFVGKALVIECRDLKNGERLTLNRLFEYGEKIDQAEFLLFNFGWDTKWGKDDYFGDYPCLGDDVIDFVINNNYKGIGVDVISIDPITDCNLTMHKKLFSNNEIINIENLKNLHLCGNDIFTLCCLPLNFRNADGAPARVVAII